MGAKIGRGENGVRVVRISGALRKEELDAVQSAGAKALTREGDARLPILLSEDFSVWIAIAGDPKWETEMPMFMGAGVRRAPVRCFPPDRLSEAGSWLV